MASKVAQKRLQKEYLSMQKSPPPFIWAVPEEKNILDWHFIIRGPPDTPYAGGEYHGLIWFPSDYPFKPPDVKMFTPTGRFECGVKICMSMTSYHPSTWNAAWSVATILTGLLSFMLSDEITAGAVKTTDEQKRQFAKASHAFNLNSKKFKDIFPKYATPQMTDLPDMGLHPTANSGAEVKSASATSAPDTPVSSVRTTPFSSEANTRTHSPAPNTNLYNNTPPNPATHSTNIPHPRDPPRSLTQPAFTAQPPETRALPNPQPPAEIHAPHRRPWYPSWRWLVAIVLLAVLGRLSQ